MHEHLLGLPVDLLLKHVGLVTLCTSCPPTLLPAPILLHEVHQATNGPSTGSKLHCIGCDVCNSYTSMFAMVTIEDQGVKLVVLSEGFTHIFEHIPQVVLVLCHDVGDNPGATPIMPLHIGPCTLEGSAINEQAFTLNKLMIVQDVIHGVVIIAAAHCDKLDLPAFQVMW